MKARVLIVIASLAGAARAQTTWFVDRDAAGSGSGQTWADAFADLQDALAVATTGDQIWVAAGVYTPSDTDAAASFHLVDGVGLFGGFAGNETSLEQRDWNLHETILSGDIGRDDVVGSGEFWYLSWNRNTPNAGHVLVADTVGSATVVDGFTIADGATGPTGTPAGHPLMFGSGLYGISASPSVRHCTFTHNLAAFAHGGAIYTYDGSPTIDDCRIIENYVHLGNGGGIYAGGTGAPAIRGCEFARNVSVHGGSGGQGQGGAITLWTDAGVTIERCVFDQNLAKHFDSVGGLEAARGAGVFNFTSPVTLVDCSFTRNQANQGGGLFTFGPAALTNCLFADNKAVPQPNDPYPELGGDGGGLGCLSFAGVTVKVTNCTFAGNAAKKYAGISAWQNATLEVENSILWGNVATDPDFVGYWESQLTKALGTIGYSCIQHIKGPPKFGEEPLEPKKIPGCLEVDPEFASGSDRSLGAASPCIDAGRNSKVPAGTTLDLAGRPRFVDDPATPDTGVGSAPLVDMGAYEFQVACYPDCERDADLDVFDFLCFQGEFAAKSAYADCEGDADWDVFDLLCFQGRFAAGCQ